MHKKAEFVYQNLRDECEKQVVKVSKKQGSDKAEAEREREELHFS